MADFNALMLNKTDEQLQLYISNSAEYEPEVISAALKELGRRRHSLPESQISAVDQIINAREIQRQDHLHLPFNPDKYNATSDENDTLLYSKQAITGFSAAFSMLCGAIILSQNIGSKKGKWLTIAFAIVYTTFELVILERINANGVYTLTLNLIGASVLNSYFWNQYVGKDIKYTAKPIWKPLIISVLVTIPLVVIMFLGL